MIGGFSVIPVQARLAAEAVRPVLKPLSEPDPTGQISSNTNGTRAGVEAEAKTGAGARAARGGPPTNEYHHQGLIEVPHPAPA